MAAHALAVKGFIVNGRDEVLLLRRHRDDVQSPGKWEIPGGRFEEGEEPLLGLAREVREETALEIEASDVLMTDRFTRSDGVRISMRVFLCAPMEGEVRLSHEHEGFLWVPVADAHRRLDEHFRPCLERYLREHAGKP